MIDNTIKISKEEYEALLHSDIFLHQLIAHGVDNWDGYDFARQDAEELFIEQLKQL